LGPVLGRVPQPLAAGPHISSLPGAPLGAAAADGTLG
jgi:hypothetical protein